MNDQLISIYEGNHLRNVVYFLGFLCFDDIGVRPEMTFHDVLGVLFNKASGSHKHFMSMLCYAMVHQQERDKYRGGLKDSPWEVLKSIANDFVGKFGIKEVYEHLEFEVDYIINLPDFKRPSTW